MAKNWSVNKENRSEMTRKYSDETKDLLIDLIVLFPGIDEYDDAQYGAVMNGVKQKLDDSIARSKDCKLTEAEKREVQEALWNRLSVDRKWNMPKGESKRGPSVSLKNLIPALNAAGLDAAAMAKIINKPVEVIEKFLETGKEETE